MKLSIIVPVYNSEKYLRCCLNSLVNQKLDVDNEIIIVDDGSNDSSGKICDCYRDKYKNVVVIHQQNSGVGMARNIGLKYAKGEYICFVDSDDMIETDMYRQLLNVIESNNADIAACNFYKLHRVQYPENIDNIIILGREECLNNLAQSELFGGYIWNKLYKKELFKDVKFENMTMAEDALVNCKIFLHINKLVYLTQPLYHYYANADSLTNSRYNINKLTEIVARKEMYELIMKNYPQVSSRFYARYMQAVIQHAVCIVENKQYLKEYKKLEAVLKHNKTAILDSEYIEKRFKAHCMRLTSGSIKARLFYRIR